MSFSVLMRGSLLLAALCLVAGRPVGNLWAQPPAENAAPQPPARASAAPTAPPIAPDVVRSRLQAIEASETLSPEVRDRAIAIYRQILTDLEARAAINASIQTWNERLEQLPAQLEELIQQLENWSSEIAAPETDELTQAELDNRVNEWQIALTTAQTSLNNLKAERNRRSDLRLEAPQRLASLIDMAAQTERRRLNELNRTDEVQEVREAQQLAPAVRLDNIVLENQQIRQELAYYEAAGTVLDKQIELAEKEVDRIGRQLAAWRTAAEQKRQARAAQDIAEKATQASTVPPELQSLAEFNLRLSETQQQVVHKIELTSQRLSDVQNQREQWREQQTRVLELIEAQEGVSESVGNLLREQREQLPSVRSLRAQAADARRSIYEVRSAKFTTDQLREDMTNLDAYLEQELRRLAQRHPAERVTSLAPQVRSLLEARQLTLTELQGNYQAYLNGLVALSTQLESMLTLIDHYAQFIDERVLWIRSIPPISLEDFRRVPAGLRWVSSADLWRELVTALGRHIERRAFFHILVVLALVALLAFRSRGVRRIQELGESAAAKGCRDFAVTVKALVWTLVVSATGPAVLSWIGLSLADLARQQPTELAAPLAAAVVQAAIAYWPFALWRTILRRKGLGEAHFGWSPEIRQVVRRHFNWYVPITLLLTAGYHLFSDPHNPIWERSIARFSLVLLAIATVVFLGFVLAPHSGVPRAYLAANRNGWLDRLRYIWFGITLAVPATLAVQVLLGYEYTVERLVQYLFGSVMFISAMYLLYALAARWLLVSRRRLAIAQAKERLLTGAPAPGERDKGELQGGVTENTQVDLTAVNAQTQRLLVSFVITATALGLFLIWIEALPALERMNEVRLWSYAEPAPTAVTVVGTGSGGSGGNGSGAGQSTSSSNGPSQAARVARAVESSSENVVTLGMLIGSLLILTMMLVAVRNIPGLLEIAVLQHLPLDAPIRFAITTVTRYALIITGLVWAFGNIGFGWSKIQWLAAAISLGLGFGLQEIFANFVSGLILLFERPLRVGDVVTVGGVTGTVVQIRTRATTIRDWDRRELIVPNKEFITGQLLNWTLSDETSRIVITVGIAYGSDIRRAGDIVLECARAHPSVLQEPEPSVTLDLFGESALNLTLRCFVAKLSERLLTTHELHGAIYSDLTSAGFTVPFPQRDVHLHLDSNGKGLLLRPNVRNSLTDT